MRYAAFPVLMLVLFIASCSPPKSPAPTGGSAAGMPVGNTFDDTPITIGMGDLKGNGLVITYFATW